MKTLDRKTVYSRGLVIGATVGIGFAAFLIGPLPNRELSSVVLILAFSVGGGVGLSLGIAALVVHLLSSEGRESAKHMAPPAVFPGMFGEPMGDPFAPIKERIDQEEPAPASSEPAPRPPATMPEKCPQCGEKLEAPASEEEPSAFCYHCGGALA